jgi:hypothetical protein
MLNLEGAAENARSRSKNSLPALPGDDDLVAYYYLVLHPNNATAREIKCDTKRKEREVRKLTTRHITHMAHRTHI